jgi:hypothetical protein
MRTIRNVIQAAVLALAASGPGCATNPWEASFRGPAGTTPARPSADAARAAVEVRLVTMDQVRAAARRAEAYLAEHKLAPEDMSDGDAAALRTMYMEEFRFKTEAESMTHLGTSTFTASRASDRDDPALLEFARKIGADVVFVATEFAGRGVEYRQTPVWSYTTGDVLRRGRDGRARWETRTWSTTTWVVVPVQVDRFSTVGLFYRVKEPAARGEVRR